MCMFVWFMSCASQVDGVIKPMRLINRFIFKVIKVDFDIFHCF